MHKVVRPEGRVEASNGQVRRLWMGTDNLVLGCQGIAVVFVAVVVFLEVCRVGCSWRDRERERGGFACCAVLRFERGRIAILWVRAASYLSIFTVNAGKELEVRARSREQQVSR